MRLRRRARSSGGVSRQAGYAALAAFTAASISAAPQSATGPSDSPVPGLMAAALRPEIGACHLPPQKGSRFLGRWSGGVFRVLSGTASFMVSSLNGTLREFSEPQLAHASSLSPEGR